MLSGATLNSYLSDVKNGYHTLLEMVSKMRARLITQRSIFAQTLKEESVTLLEYKISILTSRYQKCLVFWFHAY